MRINILGTEYEVKESTRLDDVRLEKADGWCGTYEKLILLDKDLFLHQQGGDMDAQKEGHAKFVKRHEVVHAFFNESGLDGYSANEKLVTWIARQFPKMLAAFNALDAL